MNRPLLEELETAFGMVPPFEGEITSHKCLECDDLRKKLDGKNWQDYLYSPLNLIGSFSDNKSEIFISRDCLPLLTPAAFINFLPVFLAAMLLEPQEADVMFDAMPGQFDPGPMRDDTKQWEYSRARCEKSIGLMSKAQREAVAAVFESFGPDYTGIAPTMADAVKNLRAGAVIAEKKN